MERLRNLNAGLGQYCLQLGRAIAAQPVSQALHFECYLPNYLTGILGAAFSYRATRKWHKLTGVATDASLWHCMHQDSAYWPANNKTGVIMTIHDLNFMERADYSNWRKGQKKQQLQRKVNRCQGLVYISEFVKNTVHQNFKLPAGIQEKTILNGVSVEMPLETSNETTSIPFLFSIGLHPKKNYAAALPILKSNPDYQWVITGADSNGYQLDLEKAATALGVKDQLLFSGVVTEDEKWRLYQNCTALIFPSLSEGFGLPVLEAMAFGKPVFLSNRTSLPEIGGKEAYYFNNFEPEHIQQVFSEGMKNIKTDPEKPKRLKDHASKFNWQNAAKDYLQFYQQILNQQQHY